MKCNKKTVEKNHRMSGNWLWVKMGCNKYEPTHGFCSIEEIRDAVQQQQGDLNVDLVKIYREFHDKHEDDYDEPDPVEDAGLPLFNEIDTMGLDYKCFVIKPSEDEIQCCLNFWRLYCIDFNNMPHKKQIIDHILNEIKFWIV